MIYKWKDLASETVRNKAIKDMDEGSVFYDFVFVLHVFTKIINVYVD